MDTRLFILNEPTAPRLNPALACEIGLNESLILLQLEFWISISDNARDGQQWTYQSTRDIQNKAFPFWSVMTINRTIKSLESKSLINTTAKYNTARYDKTRWFSMNYDGISKLKSISIRGYVTGSSQNDTGSNQNGTTIPENTTEIKNDVLPDHGTTPPPQPKEDPSPPSSNPKQKQTTAEAPTSTPGDIETALMVLCALIPESMRKPSVIAKLSQAIENGLTLELIKSCIKYSNDKSHKKTWQAYRSHLGQCLDKKWGEGYSGEAMEDTVLDEKKILQERLKMPVEWLKMDAGQGNRYSQRALEIIKKE